MDSYEDIIDFNDPEGFASREEELEHWKKEAFTARELYFDSQIQLEKIERSAQEANEAYNQDISSLEKANKILKNEIERLKSEVIQWKEKCRRDKVEYEDHVNTTEREIHFIQSQHEYYKSRTRELEQDNDDLERAERAIRSSLIDAEVQLKRLSAENKSLMTEVQTKDLLVEEVQRLKDDLRDLNVELSVARKHKLRQVGRVSLGGFGANQGLGDNSTKDSAFSNIVSKIKTLESQIEVATNSLGPLLANRNNHRSTTLGRPILQPRTLTSSKKSMNDALLQKSPNLNSKSSSNIIPNFNHSSSLKKSHTQHQALLNTATRNIEPPKFQRDAAMRSSLSPVTTGLKQPTQIANKIVDFAGMSEASRLRIARSKALRAELRSNSSSMFNKDNKQQRVTENA